jgi:hypothetical protein
MRGFVVGLGIVLALAVAAVRAQTTYQLIWTIEAMSFAQAQGYEYEVMIGTGPWTVRPTTCTGTVSPFTCVTPLPPISQPWTVEVAVRAVDVVTEPGVRRLGPTSFLDLRYPVTAPGPVRVRIVPSP